MLTTPLLHPGLLAALAGAGHGSQVLLADGNYPHSTGAAPTAVRVHLNLRPGLVTVAQVLEVLVQVAPFEAALVMAPHDGPDPSAFAAYRRLLPAVPLERAERHAFYAAARGDDVALVVATGDARHYANLLLTVGAVASA